jgi:RNA polymerase sigma-70 factor, ECF subfamily
MFAETARHRITFDRFRTRSPLLPRAKMSACSAFKCEREFNPSLAEILCAGKKKKSYFDARFRVMLVGNSEKDLLRSINEGNKSAFQWIFDQYYRPLVLFAMKYVGDVEDAKEIVQDVFVRLWIKRAALQVHTSLKMYLYQSVRNACLNHLEANKVVERRMKGYTQDETYSDNALEKMIVAEQEELLMAAIDRLPQKCREIFLLSRIEKISNNAIASRLNISIKTVETQISIALKRLSEWIISILALLNI